MIADYIGVPFSKYDCYALVREIYKTEHGIILPDPSIRHDENFKIYHKFVKEISNNWVKCDKQKGAVVALRYNMQHPKIVTHFGYCIGGNRFIHTLKDTNAIVDDLSKYTNIIEGYYKYAPTNSNSNS